MISSKISQVSQSSLNLWQTCPRKFQHQALQNLNLPLIANAKMEQGKRFHLLMQQQELGLDIANLAAGDPQLQKWISTFAKNPPKMIDSSRRYPESTYTFALAGYILIAVFDLLILGDRQGQILDWKTHNRPIAEAILRSSWQTRLYLYILAAKTKFLPEQISMSYWFAETAATVEITYCLQDHQQTHQEIIQILGEMAAAEASQFFPQLPLDSPVCLKCEFNYRCERGQILADISTFAEVPI